jgi:hypothetical protein
MRYAIVAALVCTLTSNLELYSNTIGSPIEASGKQQIIVNNRILAKVNDKTISVLDVMKKMEVFLSRYYPQYSDSVQAKYQYFNAQWRETLAQMIDNELMIADAEKLELKVTDSEVREAILERFGPNIMASLDKLELSYEEAKRMVQNDIIVEKMTWYRIHSKALQDVNPQDIKLAYRDYLKNNPPSEKWQYQVLSIRAKDEEQGRAFAKRAYDMLCSAKASLPEILDEVKKEIPSDSDISLTVSDEYDSDTKTISKNHKDVLVKMMADSVSEPIRQLTRADKQAVFRIFHLKDHTKILPLKFSQMSDKLKDELLEKAVIKESKNYVEKLRDKFGYDSKMVEEPIPSDFQPFVIR